MAIVILPDAQADLLDLQDYMQQRWTTALWLAAEEDIFAQLARVDVALVGQITDGDLDPLRLRHPDHRVLRELHLGQVRVRSELDPFQRRWRGEPLSQFVGPGLLHEQPGCLLRIVEDFLLDRSKTPT